MGEIWTASAVYDNDERAAETIRTRIFKRLENWLQKHGAVIKSRSISALTPKRDRPKNWVTIAHSTIKFTLGNCEYSAIISHEPAVQGMEFRLESPAKNENVIIVRYLLFEIMNRIMNREISYKFASELLKFVEEQSKAEGMDWQGKC